MNPGDSWNLTLASDTFSAHILPDIDGQFHTVIISSPFAKSMCESESDGMSDVALTICIFFSHITVIYRYYRRMIRIILAKHALGIMQDILLAILNLEGNDKIENHICIILARNDT